MFGMYVCMQEALSFILMAVSCKVEVYTCDSWSVMLFYRVQVRPHLSSSLRICIGYIDVCVYIYM